MFIDLPPSFTQNRSLPENSQVSSYFVPEKNESIPFPGTIFSFGLFKEILLAPQADLRRPVPYGLSLGMSRKMKGIWKGGLDFRTSRWSRVNVDDQTLTPLSLFSKIEGMPVLPLKSKFSGFFKPYFTAGMGYTLFLSGHFWSSLGSKFYFGRLSATYGGGILFIIPNLFGVKFVFEKWRNIDTSDYSVKIYRVEFVVGDVDHY
jgi:hypothetical protein